MAWNKLRSLVFLFSVLTLCSGLLMLGSMSIALDRRS